MLSNPRTFESYIKQHAARNSTRSVWTNSSGSSSTKTHDWSPFRRFLHHGVSPPCLGGEPPKLVLHHPQELHPGPCAPFNTRTEVSKSSTRKANEPTDQRILLENTDSGRRTGIQVKKLAYMYDTQKKNQDQQRPVDERVSMLHSSSRLVARRLFAVGTNTTAYLCIVPLPYLCLSRTVQRTERRRRHNSPSKKRQQGTRRVSFRACHVDSNQDLRCRSFGRWPTARGRR